MLMKKKRSQVFLIVGLKLILDIMANIMIFKDYKPQGDNLKLKLYILEFIIKSKKVVIGLIQLILKKPSFEV